MKKRLCLSIALCLSIGLLGCASDESKNSKAEVVPTSSSSIISSQSGDSSSKSTNKDNETVPIYKNGQINDDYIKIIQGILDDSTASVVGNEDGFINIYTQVNYDNVEKFILSCSAITASIVSDPSVQMIVLKFGGDLGGIITTSWDGDVTHIITAIKVNEDEPLKEELEKAYSENGLFAIYDINKKIDSIEKAIG